MKRSIFSKLLTMLVLIALVCVLVPVAIAETPKDFDYKTILSEETGYDDRFDDFWAISNGAVTTFPDGTSILWVLFTSGPKTSGSNPESSSMMFYFSDLDGNFVPNKAVYSVDILVGNKIYSFNTLDFFDYSGIIMGPKCQWLTEAIVKTDVSDIALRLDLGGTYLNIEGSELEYFADLQKQCKLFNQYFVDYYREDGSITSVEDLISLKVDGQVITKPYSQNGSYN